MSKKKSSSPFIQRHDAFFKSSLKEKKVAIDFFKAHLPESIQQRINWDSLTLTDKEYVDPEFRKLHSDLVYRCTLDQHTAYFYTLVEHQSSPDAHMAFRLWQYSVALMNDHLKQGHTYLPIVFPICIYQGQISPYPYSCAIWDEFEDPALAQQSLFAPFHLVDLTTLSEEQMQKHGQAAALEWLMKHIHHKDFARRLKAVLNNPATYLLVKGPLQTGGDYFENALKYIVLWAEGFQDAQTAQELFETMTEAFPTEQEIVMSIADVLRKEGKEEGKEEGILLGKEEGIQETTFKIAKQLFEENLSIERIEKITGLKRNVLMQLQA